MKDSVYEKASFKVNEHYNEVKKYLEENNYEGKILVTALYGSQNYNIATESSDVDTKTIYVPTMEEVILQDKPLSVELNLEDNEKANVKDVRLFAKECLKGNINALELFYSTTKTADNFNFDKLQKYAKLICQANPFRVMACAYGMANTIDKTFNVNKYQKQLSNLYRLERFMEEYFIEEDFMEAIWMDNGDDMICINYKTLPVENKEAIPLAKDEYINKITMLFENAKLYYENYDNFKYEKAKNILDNFCVQMIMKGEFLG